MLAIFTTLGLLGVPLVVGGLLLLIGAKRMPARTAKGTAMTRRVNGFRIVIEKAEEHMSKWAEQENVFTRFLPYAIVFGVTDKWAKAFESLGQLPTDTDLVRQQPAVRLRAVRRQHRLVRGDDERRRSRRRRRGRARAASAAVGSRAAEAAAGAGAPGRVAADRR